MQRQRTSAYACMAGGGGSSSAQASASSTCAWFRSSRRAALMGALALCRAIMCFRPRLWCSTMPALQNVQEYQVPLPCNRSLHCLY